MRAPAAGGKRIKDAHSPVNVAGAELDGLIRDLFRLAPPDREPARDVATSGHAEHQSGTQSNGTGSHEPVPNSVNGTHSEQPTPFSSNVNSLA